MKKLVDVIILIEHKNRELGSAKLIKQNLEKLNIQTEIIPIFYKQGFAMLKYSPKLIITPWSYSNHEIDLIRGFKGGLPNNTFNILNLHHEQISFRDSKEFMIPSGDAVNTYHISWGKYFKNILVENSVSSNLIRTTGSIRLEILKNQKCII